MIFARERDSARGAGGECCWTSPSVTFQKEKLMACVDFLLLVVIRVVSLYMVIERFRYSQKKNEQGQQEPYAKSRGAQGTANMGDELLQMLLQALNV